MKTRQQTEFLRTDGLYQSTKKLTGEIHAACFLYTASWTYLRFMTENSIQIFNSNFDLTRMKDLTTKIGHIKKITDKYEFYPIKDEHWSDGTFTFKRKYTDETETEFYGHLRTDIYGEQELLLVDHLNRTDNFKFIKFEDNQKLEFEYLNLFSSSKYLSTHSFPNFGYSDIETAISFQTLKNGDYIRQLGDNHLDHDTFFRTEKGDNYYKKLKEKRNEK
ncbi:MAG: hypothetical protein SGJ15_11680 [Bacteroidota bacterium]|nr:hypothetical protein [Bacteroidota bacterium]